MLNTRSYPKIWPHTRLNKQASKQAKQCLDYLVGGGVGKIVVDGYRRVQNIAKKVAKLFAGGFLSM